MSDDRRIKVLPPTEGERLLYELRIRIPADVQIVHLGNANIVVVATCPTCDGVIRPHVNATADGALVCEFSHEHTQ